MPLSWSLHATFYFPQIYNIYTAIKYKYKTCVDLNLISFNSQIDNPGWKGFPVNVSLNFPLELEHNFEIINYQVFVGEVTWHQCFISCSHFMFRMICLNNVFSFFKNKTQCTDHADMKTAVSTDLEIKPSKCTKLDHKEWLLCYSKNPGSYYVIVSSWTKGQQLNSDCQETFILEISNSMQRYVTTRVHTREHMHTNTFYTSLYFYRHNTLPSSPP